MSSYGSPGAGPRVVTDYNYSQARGVGESSSLPPKLGQYVCSRIRQGFRIGFDYHQALLIPVHRNMKSAVDHREVVEKYLGEEREA